MQHRFITTGIKQKSTNDGSYPKRIISEHKAKNKYNKPGERLKMRKAFTERHQHIVEIIIHNYYRVALVLFNVCIPSESVQGG